MDCSTPGFPVHHQLPELAQTLVHWVSDAIQSSHPLSSPFSSCLQSFPASGSFPRSQFFTSGGQSIGTSVSISVLPVNTQDWNQCMCIIVSNSLRPHALWPTGILCPWESPSKNDGVGCYFLLQGIFPTRDQTWVSCVSCIAGRFFNTWAPGEALGFGVVWDWGQKLTSHVLQFSIQVSKNKGQQLLQFKVDSQNSQCMFLNPVQTNRFCNHASWAICVSVLPPLAR